MPDLYTHFLQVLHQDPFYTSLQLVTPPTINWLLNSMKLSERLEEDANDKVTSSDSDSDY